MINLIKSILKTIIILVIFTVIWLVGAVNFGTESTNYECIVTRNIESTQKSKFPIYVQLKRYKWWSGIFRNDDYEMAIESDDFNVSGFYSGKSSDTQIQFKNFIKNDFYGSFSLISGRLYLRLSNNIQYDGICRKN